MTTHQVTKTSTTGPGSRPELVFGLIGALGTELDPLQDELQIALRSVAYENHVIRLSKLISEVCEGVHGFGLERDELRMAHLMRQGDKLRDLAGPAAAVALGIRRLRDERSRDKPTGGERRSHATILRSIKRKDEVEELREVYGNRFVLIGAWTNHEDRAAAIEQKLRADHPGEDSGWYRDKTTTLMDRDEQDDNDSCGQGVREAFKLADVYVAIRAGHPVGHRIARLVRLLFGESFETPTRAEEAMFLAAGAALRSSAAGRQVGVAVVDGDGELLVTGTNEAPKAGGGQYWTEETPDHRDFTYGHDVNDRLKQEIVADTLKKLRDEGWLAAKYGEPSLYELAGEAVNGPLRDSRVADLLEFGRIAHAEMAAICTAARRGTALRKATMYTTTFPCHECTRLIIAAGISKVVYIDPYPKSRVKEMFCDEVSEGHGARHGTIPFEPFEGVASHLFQKLFGMQSRSRNRETGRYIRWGSEKHQMQLLADGVTQFTQKEDEIANELGLQLKAHRLNDVVTVEPVHRLRKH